MKYNPENHNNTKPGSKYLKKPEDKKKSKYIRDDNDKKSKYLKDKNDSREEHHYNLTRHYDENGEKIIDRNDADNAEFNEELNNIDELNNDAIENAAQADENIENAADIASADDSAPVVNAVDDVSVQESEGEAIKPEASDEEIDASFSNTEEADSDAKQETKGDISSIFQHSGVSRDTAVASVDDGEEKGRSKLILSTLLSMLLLTGIAILLQRYKFSVDLLPSMLSIDLSAFPELIASLAYGPVFGIIIIVVKNLVVMLIHYTGAGTVVSNVVLDSIFIIVAGWFYSRRMFTINPKKSKKPSSKDLRRRRIITGGFLGTVITTAVSFFLTRYVSYPIIFREYGNRGLNADYVINNYQIALNKFNELLPERMSGTVTEFTDLSQAIIFYNIPVQFFKYLLIAVVVALIYVFISPYLHFRVINNHD